MDNLNDKMGSDNNVLGHAVGRYGLADRNNNGERFADFCSFYDLVIGRTETVVRLAGFRLTVSKHLIRSATLRSAVNLLVSFCTYDTNYDYPARKYH